MEADQVAPDEADRPAGFHEAIMEFLARNGSKSLFKAIREETFLTVQELLSATEHREDIKKERESESGDALLHIAVRENKVDIAKALMKWEAEVDARNNAGETPLHVAVQTGSLNLVKFLCAAKAKSDIQDKHLETALHIAARNRHDAILDLLLSRMKANATIKNKDGETPLFVAVRSGTLHAVRELLNQGFKEADIKAAKTKSGDTLTHAVAGRKNVEMAQLLVERGAPRDEQNNDGSTPLHIAAYEGDEALVNYLHTLKVNPNIPDKLQRTPLHVAVTRGHVPIIELLIDKFKADIFHRTKMGNTLLHLTCLSGNLETTVLLVRRGVLPQMPNKQGTLCIHNAARKGFLSILKALLEKGVPVDIMDKKNYTPLHIAVISKKHLAVQLLIGYGANVDMKGGPEGETALHMAAKLKGSSKTVDVLIKSGACVEAAKNDGERPMHVATRVGNVAAVQQLLEENAEVARRCKSGDTALHFACAHGHYEIMVQLVQRLFKGKSNAFASLVLNIPNDRGETALHVLAGRMTSAEKSDDELKIAHVLLEKGGNLALETQQKKETALHYASRSGNDVVMKAFLSSGAVPLHVIMSVINKVTKSGTSPLALASLHGNLDVVRVLLRFHARVDVFDETGSTALHQAVSGGHTRVAHELLDHKIYVNGRTKLGVTPLHIAAEKGFVDCIRVLVMHYCATVDACDMDKRTPLHLASLHGTTAACRLLLDCRAEPGTTDQKKMTPVHYAAMNDHADVVELFYKLAPETLAKDTPDGLDAFQLAAREGCLHVVKKMVQLDVGNCSKDKGVLYRPLMLAAQNGHRLIIEFLMGEGASATKEDSHGMNVLHLASKFGQMKVIDMLWGKVPFEQRSSKTGRAAVHDSALFGQLDVLQDFLARSPSSASFATEDGFTPLHFAAHNGDVSLVRVLMNHPGVRLDAVTTSQGFSSLHIAAQEGHLGVVSTLISKMAMLIHLKDARGRLPLHLAAAGGHTDVCTVLIGQGAELNVQATDGNTALHLAASAGYLAIVRLLIEYRESPLTSNQDGKFPLSLAAASRRLDVLDYLLFQQFNDKQLLADNQFLFDLMACARLRDQKPLKNFVLNSPVPVTSATFLTRHYRTESRRRKEFAKDLMAASDECQTMGTDLVAVACKESSERVLNCMNDENIPLMDVLVECSTKDCVSHVLVQRYLTRVWYGELNVAQWKLVLLFLVSLLCPPIWVYLSLPFNNKFRHVPVLKFICRLISHVYLIVLLCLTAVVPWRHSATDLSPHWYEIGLLVWVVGLLLAEITTTRERSGFGWIPLFVVVLGLFSAWLHLIALVFEGDARVQVVFVKNQCLGVALVLCIMQLFQFLSIHHLFGPWGIIIGHLMADVLRFFTIFSLFVVSFALQLLAVYKPLYEDTTLHGDIPLNPRLGYIVESLFFALFGLTARTDLQPKDRTPPGADHMAKIIFAVYVVICVIILVNLLIAMMSDTYQRIQERSDIEWKFGRAKMIRKMELESPNPVPINIFSKFVHIYRVIYHNRCRCCHDGIVATICNDESTEPPIPPPIRAETIRRSAEDGSTTNPVVDLQLQSVVDWRLMVERFHDVRGETCDKRAADFQAWTAGAATSRMSATHVKRSGEQGSFRSAGEATAIRLDVINKLKV